MKQFLSVQQVAALSTSAFITKSHLQKQRFSISNLACFPLAPWTF